jgi:hypothetical protein
MRGNIRAEFISPKPMTDCQIVEMAGGFRNMCTRQNWAGAICARGDISNASVTNSAGHSFGTFCGVIGGIHKPVICCID